MNFSTPKLTLLPCLDSEEMATSRRRDLDLSHEAATVLGKSAVAASRNGFYITQQGKRVEWGSLVEAAVSAKASIAPDDSLPPAVTQACLETRIQVTNESTLLASRRLVAKGVRPLALNFANGVQPGGGFLWGACAQEEVLCRSSSLFSTLVDDSMYDHHREHAPLESTDWAIYSPDVPVFRRDDGTELEEPWLLSFITCAAPYAPSVGSARSGELLRRRIHRVLEIAQAFQHDTLVLGAWGCGAFGNAPTQTAVDFRRNLETAFSGSFSDVTFAITDWSPDRKTLGPFRDIFAK